MAGDVGQGMKKSAKKEWLKALRSGDYKQTDSLLYNENKDAYCCLGVVYDVCIDGDWVCTPQSIPGFGRWCLPGLDRDGDEAYTELTEGVLRKLELSYEECDHLIHMNDKGCSFEVIANYIEENM